MESSDNKNKSKIYRIRVELVALVILVPLALVLGAVIIRLPRAGLPNEQAVLKVSPQGSVLPESASGQADDTVGAEDKKEQTVGLVIKYLGKTLEYDVAVTGETTVEQVLNEVVQQRGLLLETKDFGGSMGIFVKAINGVANDSGSNMYWQLYVNGELSPVGASTARVRPGDTVTWQYELQHEKE